MEVIISLSTILKDIIKDVDDPKTKRTFISEHIKNVTKVNSPVFELPEGLDWFNVTQPLTDSALRGKVIVLDFFTYCCINCLHIMPHLRKLEENFSIADGLVVIGVHSAKFENEKNSSNIAFALKKYNIKHPVINDCNSYLWDKLQISCWPTTLILDPDGHVLFVLIGEECSDQLFLYVESTLNFHKSTLSSHSLPVDNSSNVISSGYLNFPSKIVRFENNFALSDSGNHRILIINEDGEVQFKIGGRSSGFRDGTFEEARFNSPQGIAFYNNNKIYVADTENHAIRLIDIQRRKVTTVAGTGNQGSDYVGGKNAKFQELSSPWDLCFVSSGHVKDFSPNTPTLKSPGVSIASNASNDMPPPPCPPIPPPCTFPSFSPAAHRNFSKGNMVVTDKNSVTSKVLLIAMSGVHQIWALFLEDTSWWRGRKYEKDVCVTIAGTGREENRNNTYPLMASFAQPSGLVYSEDIKSVFIADSESSCIRKLSLEDGSVSHVVGGDKNPADLFSFGDIDGRGYNAKLQHPLGLTYSKKKNVLYICDSYNNKLKEVDLATKECRNLHKENDLFNEPSGCCLSETEEILYIADTNNNCISVLDLKERIPRKLNVRESESVNLNTKSTDHWELETEVNGRGADIHLIVHLLPEDIHGSWKLVIGNSNVKSDRLNGEFSSEPQELRLRAIPSDTQNTDVLNLFFNVSFCQNDVCMYKKYILQLRIKRNPRGPDAVKLEFRKKIS